MKVLHILGELNPSGAETMLYAAGPLLSDFDIAGEILSTGSQVGPYADQLASAGYSIHHIAFKKSPWFFWSVFKLLKSRDYDVVHQHTERANFWLGLLALLTGHRCVRTIHATFPFTGLLGWTRKWQRQLLNQMGLTHIAISQSVHDTEYKHYRLQTPVIQNWYNSQRFCLTTLAQKDQARETLNISANTFVLLTIGNCAAVKNHGALIEALATIDRKEWLYLHVGIEKDSSERDLATQLDIVEQIRFEGLQTDILSYLQAADLFVMPSLHEGFGIAAIEAIATGLPTLLTDVPGLADFKTVFNGLFYCQPKTEAMASVLNEIIAISPEHCRKQCVENPDIAEQRFGTRRGLAGYVDFYKN